MTKMINHRRVFAASMILILLVVAFLTVGVVATTMVKTTTVSGLCTGTDALTDIQTTVTFSGICTGTAPVTSTTTTSSTTTTTAVNDSMIAIDGSNNARCWYRSASCSTSFQTTHANDLVYVGCNAAVAVTVNVVSTPPTHFTERTHSTFAGIDEISAWYAIWPSSGTITVSCIVSSGSTGDSGIVAFGISGGAANLFDPNPLIPSTNIGTGNGPATVVISTSNANDMIIGIGTANSNLFTPSPGFQLIPGSPNDKIAAEYEVVSAIQSNLHVQFSLYGYSDWGIIGDAIEAASS